MTVTGHKLINTLILTLKANAALSHTFVAATILQEMCHFQLLQLLVEVGARAAVCGQHAGLLDELLQVALPQLLVQLLQLLLLDLMVSGWESMLV